MIPDDFKNFLQNAMSELYDSAAELSKAKNISFGEAVEFIKTTSLITISATLCNTDVNLTELINFIEDREDC